VCRSTAEMCHFFSRSKVHGRVQSPLEFRYPLLHTALLPCPRSLHSLSISILGLQALSFFIQVSKLSRSPSKSPNSPRRACTTRIHRVSGKRPAICSCFYLWGVIQLHTVFKTRKNLKLDCDHEEIMNEEFVIYNGSIHAATKLKPLFLRKKSPLRQNTST